jgi:hypothetical protein
MRKLFLLKSIIACSLMLLVLISSCKRTDIPTTPDPTPTNPTGGVVNDATQVTASVSGIVLDETNAPIANAVVTSGTATTTTNTNGMFIFQNISLSKENGNVTVVKAGYFKGIRSFKTTAGKNHTVRIQLMQRVLSGTVNAAAGGTITSNGGASIVFPANAFVTSAGAAYTGTVNVYSRWIDPTAANLPFVIPGDLRGVSTTGVENILETYGMVGAELADASGNILKIATGKTATVSFPIPTSLSATAPASIVLWHFDDATARWKENGTATKTGSSYTAQVDKFSFWNVDVGTTNFINLDYTLINATTNTPLVSTYTRIKRISSGNYGYGFTNSMGFVSGSVPKNEPLVLEVVSGCGTVIYSQNIGSFVANTSLGNVVINLPISQYINFTGTLLNCNGVAIADGYVNFYGAGGVGAFINTNQAGAFSFAILNCSSNLYSYSYQCTDNITNQQSPIISNSAVSGNVNLGNINVCGVSLGIDVYVAGYKFNGTRNVATVCKNGIASELTDGTKNAFAYSVVVSGNDVYAAGVEEAFTNSSAKIAKFWKNGIPTNLTNGVYEASANSIFVNGTDVYVAGFEATNTLGSLTTAKIWKNGVATNLTNGLTQGKAFSVYVSGTDVYVAGTEESSTGTNVIAKLWKNGVATNLTNGNGTIRSSANSVFVSGADVYVCGYQAVNSIGALKIAKIWKNGVPTDLNDGTTRDSPSSIFVVGNDVYISATGTYTLTGLLRPQVWKNGVQTILATAVNNAFANSIFVWGNDVYVTGYDGTSNGATVWKNGIPTNLGTTNCASGYSVFVK